MKFSLVSHPLLHSRFFLTDYSPLYAVKVVRVSQELKKLVPSYYQEKGLNVRVWFVCEVCKEILNVEMPKISSKKVKSVLTKGVL